MRRKRNQAFDPLPMFQSDCCDGSCIKSLSYDDLEQSFLEVSEVRET